jgi:hypothetical protein
MLILVLPMLLFFSQNALAKGWHDRLVELFAGAPDWLLNLILWLHGFLCCYG